MAANPHFIRSAAAQADVIATGERFEMTARAQGPDRSRLHLALCLGLIAAAYSLLSIELFLHDGATPTDLGARTAICWLLCVLAYRGIAVARLVLGGLVALFVAPMLIAVVLGLHDGAAVASAADLALTLILGSAGAALFVVPSVRDGFARAREVAASSSASAP